MKAERVKYYSEIYFGAFSLNLCITADWLSRQALVDFLEWRLNHGKLGPCRCVAVHFSGCGTSSWEQEAPLEHEPPTGRSWDACPGITQGNNKAFFSSLNQASRMGCLLAFVFGANQQTYSGQHNGIVGLQWKLGRGPGPPLQRALLKNRGLTSHWFGYLALMPGFWWNSDLLLAHKIAGSLPVLSTPQFGISELPLTLFP